MLYRHRKQAEITASIGNESSASTATLLERLKRDLSVLDHDPSASREITSKVIHEFCRRYGITHEFLPPKKPCVGEAGA
jgi:transposase